MLNKPERNYSVYEKEFVAVVHFVKFFRTYLLGRHFYVYTDHQALRYILYIKNDASSRVLRWQLAMQEYDFDVYYRPGKQNANPDALSRLPERAYAQEERLHSEDNEEDVKSLRQWVLLTQKTFSNHTTPVQQHSRGLANLRGGVDAQEYADLWMYLTAMSYPPKYDEKARARLRAKAADYEARKDGIYKRPNERHGYRKLVQEKELLKVLQECHDHWIAGHQGVKRTCDRVCERYYWPGYFNTVRQYVMSCKVCQLHGPKNPPVPLIPYQAPKEGPLSELMIDFLSVGVLSEQGNTSAIVGVDMFSRWPEAKATPNQTAKAAVGFLYEWICRYGLPRRIISDNGPHFTAGVTTAMLSKYGLRIEFGPPHHSHRQGKVERMIKSIKAILKRLCTAYVGAWDVWLLAALFVIRTSKTQAYDASPFFIMHGRHPRTHEDYDLPQSDEAGEDDEELLVLRLEEIIGHHEYTLPRMIVRQEKYRWSMKEKYDKKAKPARYLLYDQVWVQDNISKRFKSALPPRWFGPYRVKEVLGRNTYRLQDGNLTLPHPYHADQMKIYMTRPKTYTSHHDSSGELEEPSSHGQVEVGGMRGSLPPTWRSVVKDDSPDLMQQPGMKRSASETSPQHPTSHA
ncbi:hypothetical protein O0I10_013045 [Lichtheimia ornata]|uniref:Integrase catalytic domain-containing protein n=1 Tax=Lichtheimia ornata TaxID=688661 RepID=A0AAD7XSJ7_9FUNG|nr:uncharacterized protein O0I10_013045 [Lichtheimia ornata]KAJ8651413.1 hypothetical protein O0I10_013045 [Lichtheimia ornata]